MAGVVDWEDPLELANETFCAIGEELKRRTGKYKDTAASFDAIGEVYEKAWEELRLLPIETQCLYATHLVSLEVDNGGFHQYFWNQGVKSADLAIVGFEAIGAPEHAKRMQDAVALFAQKSGSDETRSRIHSLNSVQKILKAFSESANQETFDTLDDRQFKSQSSEDLSELLAKYVRNHADVFVTYLSDEGQVAIATVA